MAAITKAPHAHLVMLGFSPRAASALRATTPDWETILRTGALTPRQVRTLRSGNLTLKKLIREAGFTRHQALSVLSLRSASEPEGEYVEISDQFEVGGNYHEVLGSFVAAQDGDLDVPAPPFAETSGDTLAYIVAIGTLEDVWAKVLAGTSLGVEGTDWVQSSSTAPATTAPATLTVSTGDSVVVVVRGPLKHPNQKINVTPIKTKIHDHQHPAPPPEGGGDTPPPPLVWTDDFERSDRFLNGDNGWANINGKANGALGMPRFEIVSGAATVTSALAHPWGWAPICHARTDSDAGVADVTFEYEIGPNVAAGGLRPTFVVACANPLSDAPGASGGGIVMDLDPTTTDPPNFYLLMQDESEATAQNVTVESPWEPLAATIGASATIRMVFTDATKTLQVYQDGVLRWTVDYSDASFPSDIVDPLSYPDTPYCPALADMPNMGIGSDSNGNQDVFNLVGTA